MPAPVYYPADAGPFATSAKPVSLYEDLQALSAKYEDAIIAAVDFETVDHCCYSERHWGYRARPHVTRPYSCCFAKSYFCNKQKAMNMVTEKMKWFSTKSLTQKEAAAGQRRQVIVLYWDAQLETRVFADIRVDIIAHGAKQWGFQLLSTFGRRFNHNRNNAGVVLYTLGVNAKRLPYGVQGYHFAEHHAANDCWGAVAGFLQVISMARQKWKWKRWAEEKKKGR